MTAPRSGPRVRDDWHEREHARLITKLDELIAHKNQQMGALAAIRTMQIAVAIVVGVLGIFQALALAVPR